MGVSKTSLRAVLGEGVDVDRNRVGALRASSSVAESHV